MTYDPNTRTTETNTRTTEPYTRTTERDVIETRQGPNFGGPMIATILVVLAILAAVWLFTNDGEGTTDTTTSPVETTLPVETTIPADTTLPADTTVPADTTPTTTAP